MSDKLEQNKAIIAGVPVGATEIDDTGKYWIYEGDGDYLLWDNGSWIESWSPFHTRSLADIKALIAKDKRIAELEKKLFTQENEANKAVLRACNMLVEKDDLIIELEEYNLSLANESCEQQGRIAELEKYNLSLANESCEQQKRIAELEEFRTEFSPLASHLARECNTTDGDLLFRFKDWLAKRHLERHAKGRTE